MAVNFKGTILCIGISSPPKSGAESIQFGKYIQGFHHHGAAIDLVTTPVPERGWNREDTKLRRYLQGINQVVEVKESAFLQKIYAKFGHKPFPDRHEKFAQGTGKVLHQLKNRPDFIYGRGMPFSSALLAVNVAEALKVPLVLHLADPYTLNPYNFKEVPQRASKLEHHCFSHADIVAFTTPLTRRLYAELYPDLKSKFHVFPNVYSQDEHEHNEQLPEKFTLRYTGNLYGERNLNALTDAIQKLTQANTDFRDSSELIINGRCDELSSQYLLKSGWKGIKVEGPLDYESSLAAQRKSHLLISTDRPAHSLNDLVFLPSKLLDYAVSRRPVLNISSSQSESSNFVRQNSLGETFQHNEEQEIMNFVQSCFTKYKREDTSFFHHQLLPEGYGNIESTGIFLKEIIRIL